MARHYKIASHEIVELLKSIDSPYTMETNRIVGFIDGSPIKRTTYHMQVKKIFEKLHRGITRHRISFPDEWDGNDKVKFITEAMYSYLKWGENNAI
jgi:hypothetical protein